MKNKLFFTLTLIVSLFFSGISKAWAETGTRTVDGVEWELVDSPEGFKAAVKANKNVQLTADIDLSTLTPEKSDCLFGYDFTFKGRINGECQLTDGTKVVYLLKNSQVIIFRKMEDAILTGLAITDSYFTGWDEHSGQLAVEAKNCTLTDVSIYHSTALGDQNDCDCDRMGGLIGEAEGCTFTNVKAMACVLRTDGQYAGLLVGMATSCHFTECSANAASGIWADGNSVAGINGNAYVGGLCGYATNSDFTQCVNLAMVSSDDDRMGGIVGYATGTQMTDCINYGPVVHSDLTGFDNAFNTRLLRNASITLGSAILGSGAAIALGVGIGANGVYALTFVEAVKMGIYYFCKVAMLSCWAVAAVAAVVVTVGIIYTLSRQPDEAGGIAGKVEGNSHITRCSNYGFVKCCDAYSGGIVGYAESSSIEACLNQGFVYGQEQLGGIVGYIKSCTVRNNLSMSTVKSELAEHMGMIVGEADGSNNTLSGNYFLDRESKDYGSSKAVTQEQLASGAVTIALNQAIAKLDADSKDVFRQNLGTSIYPTLNPEDGKVTAETSSYNLWQQVSTPAELCKALVNGCSKIELTADIDMSQSLMFALYTRDYPFSGEIKGNGHVISGVNYAAQELLSDTSEPIFAALFSFAKGAKFENLIINNFHITQADEKFGSLDNLATLVGYSDGCQYNNVTVRNSTILMNADEDWLDYVGGLVSESVGDTFTGCTAEGTCTFNGFSGNTNAGTYVGGIAAKATGSTFMQCHNASTIWADDDYEGGIVAWAENCTISSCLNTGHITAQEYVGGIVGYGKNTVVTHCVNTGVIDDDDKTREDYRCGIAGYLTGADAKVEYCINYGSVNHAEESTCSPINNKREEGATWGAGNYFYCQYNGKHADNESQHPDPTYYRYDKMLTGEFALNATDADGNHWLYQDIDNVKTFATNMPVPIPAAGQVHSNILCDGTQSYSNRYQSTAAHTSVPNDLGICTICGKHTSSAVSDISISNAEELIDFAKMVNSGADFSGHTITLANDIDMNGYSYVPIGNGIDTPFKGTFDGQGHRIKNASYYGNGCSAGLFGVVSGTSVIKNLTVDSSCSFASNGYGAAGIVGCMALPTEGTNPAMSLTMTACGNEANITGNFNAAGLIGGVYNDETYKQSTITLTNCYNAGTIAGTTQSAALIGYAMTVNATKCFNVGSVEGFDTNHAVIRCQDYAKLETEEVFNWSEVAKDANATSATTQEFTAGTTCYILRNGAQVWSQNLGTEYYPTLSEGGIRHERAMKNRWGTVCLPYVIKSDDEVQLYTLSSMSTDAGGEVVFTPTDELIAANTPCVFKKKKASATSVAFSAGNNLVGPVASPSVSTPVDGFTLYGTYAQVTIGGTEGNSVYFIAQDKLWCAEAATTVSPFRAWFTGPASSNNAPLRIVEGDGTESISAVRSEELGVSSCFDLMGRQTVGRKGLQIRNGRVVLVK